MEIVSLRSYPDATLTNGSVLQGRAGTILGASNFFYLHSIGSFSFHSLFSTTSFQFHQFVMNCETSNCTKTMRKGKCADPRPATAHSLNDYPWLGIVFKLGLHPPLHERRTWEERNFKMPSDVCLVYLKRNAFSFAAAAAARVLKKGIILHNKETRTVCLIHTKLQLRQAVGDPPQSWRW